MVEVVSVEGKNEEIPLDNDKVVLSTQALGDLVKKYYDLGMLLPSLSPSSYLLNGMGLDFPLSSIPSPFDSPLPPGPPPFLKFLL
jgi:hypothetical protein